MNSRVRFSVCVAVLTSAATMYWDAGEAAAQGYSGQRASQSQRKTGGLLGRFFSKRKSQPEQPPAAAPAMGTPSQQYQAQQYQAQQYQAAQYQAAQYQAQPQYSAPQQYPTQQVQAQQYPLQQQQPAQQYTRPAAPRRSKIQELLEARYRAEGREMPPLTMQQLAVQQEMEMQHMMPQTPQPQPAQQTQQAYQTPYQQAQQPQQQQFQMPQRATQQYQPQYAAGQPSAGQSAYGQSRPVTSPAAGGYAAQQQQQPRPAASPEKPRRRGFRAFLSRINPFHKDKDEEPQTAPQSLPSATGQYPQQPQYAQQPPRQQPGYPPHSMQPHRGQQVAQPRRTQSPVAPQMATTPPGYRTPYNTAARSPYGQPAVNDTMVEPRPFPGVPNVASEAQNIAAQPQREPTIDFNYSEPQQQFADDVPMLAEMPVTEESIDDDDEDEIDLFADEPLPNLADVNVAPETAPTTDDGFRPTEQPQFEEPIITNEEPVIAADESTELTADEPQVAADDSASPYTGMTLDEEEAELPKLQPVPMRNNYINLEHLNAEVDSEALRREKRRLLLLSRPELSGLKGFCPVTLKNDRDLVDARPEFQVEFESKVYQLSSEEAKQEFERSPQEYAPAKGGIDMVKYTLGAGEVEGTLEFAAWYRDRLYLFSSAVTYDAFMRNPGKFAAPPQATTAEESALDDAANNAANDDAADETE